MRAHDSLQTLSAVALMGIVVAVWTGCAIGGGGSGDAESDAGGWGDTATTGGDDAGHASGETGSNAASGSGSGSGGGSGSGSSSGATHNGDSGPDGGSESGSDGASPPAIDCSSASFPVQQGATGSEVSAFQGLLQHDGYYVNEPVDGTFGAVTAAAVEGFQLGNGKLTVSGTIDSATCEALEHPAKPKPVFMYVNPNATPTYDLKAMKESGVTDVFFMDTGSFSNSDWQALQSQCKSAGLRLSAWEFMTASASYVGSLASLGLNIHMDLEDGSCNGSVSCVTGYVQSIRAACPGKLFTVATMPDGADSALYYGQDYGQLAQSVDAICPMLYKGNYSLTDAKLTSDAALMQGEAPGKIWITMQTYASDSNVVALSAGSLLTDVNAITASANGVGFFRYGLLNFGVITD